MAKKCKGDWILMPTNENSYQRRILQEAQHWTNVAERMIADGFIPDLRRWAKLKQVTAMWHDPEIEKIMRGKFKEFIIRKASEVGGRALDLGCGMGWLSLELARNGMAVDAIDISEGRIQIAKDYLAIAPKTEKFGSINYIVADLNEIILEKSVYESVVAWDTMHHIPKIDRLMDEVEKALKPGGNLIALDHVGISKPGQLLAGLFCFLLPTDTSYSKKLKLIVESMMKKRPAGNQSMSPDRSPFEDVTQREMIECIKKRLSIQELRTTLSFSAGLVPRIRLRDPLKYALIRVLKFLDDIFIQMKILQGEYAFIWARKEMDHISEKS